jgi:hypothetical protein
MARRHAGGRDSQLRAWRPARAAGRHATELVALPGGSRDVRGNDVGGVHQGSSPLGVTLGTAVQRDYLLLACDALEALAAIAGRQGRLTEAGVLLVGGENVRQLTGYRFRFRFEQAVVDDLRASIAQAGKPDSAAAADARDWQAAAAFALPLAGEIAGHGQPDPARDVRGA